MRKRKFDSSSEMTTSDIVVSSSKSIFRRWKKLIVVIFILSVWLLVRGGSSSGGGHVPSLLDRVALRLGYRELVYVVIVDAGSTGTRALAFTFFRNVNDGSLKLDDEFFIQSKPGISAFVDSPDKAGESIDKLLEAAARHVPADVISHTPVVLRATAGLRLLPGRAADTLLESARAALRRSGFAVAPDAVSIMSGLDEGLFSWFTVNFLLDKLGGDPADTVAVFDLGGGSSQLTFVPVNEQTVYTAPADHIVKVSVLQHPVTIYSKSYLGAGLMAARHMILTSGLPKNTIDVTSVCVNPAVKTSWDYAGTEYHISGMVNASKKQNAALSDSAVDFVACHVRTASVTKQHISIHAPSELRHRQIYAISYFFDRAADVGLVHPLDGGTITVLQLMMMAKTVCDSPNQDQPLACLDFSYIVTLLRTSLQLEAGTELHLRKRIDGHETSWALGAAFHTLTNQG